MTDTPLLSLLPPLTACGGTAGDGLTWRELARLSQCCKALRDAIILNAGEQQGLWRDCAVNQHGCNPKEVADGRASCIELVRTRGVWSTRTAFGSTIERFDRALLNLGSGVPSSLRVAAVSTMLSLRPSSCCTLSFRLGDDCQGLDRGAILWLGVLFNKRDVGAELDVRTAAAAIEAYRVGGGSGSSSSSSRKRAAGGASISERFGALAEWSMSALGSNGAVWSDGKVTALHGDRGVRFGARGDVIRMTLLERRHGELSFVVIPATRVGDSGGRNAAAAAAAAGANTATAASTLAAGAVASPRGIEVKAVQRLLPRSSGGTRPPRVYAIAHLTDVQRAPSACVAGATAVVELGRLEIAP